ncbi:signal transduction histidine kinase [Sphingomonas sp. BE123]|uniref:PAS domain-containing sensor histidine kinase n=1 Tax=Sphingomonas sp. BE123 TaxID=2817842 RepID=UPI002864D033|nr:ATP-binding protein [Sphingomonas sp. BE123]MDR6853180.1 signal transduction histidine kinase [Sphingomonas sp. BE123]
MTPQRPRRMLACALAIASILPLLAILSGWAFDIAVLRGMGAASRPVHPMTAFTFLTMAGGAVLIFGGYVKAARLLLIFPLIYLTLIFIQHLTGLDSGISRLLFAETMASDPALGRPITPMGAVVVLAALLAALYLRSARSAMARPLVGQVAGIAIAATLLLLAFTVGTQLSYGARFIGVAAATAVPVLLLCGAVLVSLDGPRAAPRPDTPWDTLQRIHPVIIVCSVIPTMVLIALRQRAMLSDAELYFLIALANLICLAALLAYVTHRADVQSRILAVDEARLKSILGTAPDALIVTGDDLVIRAYSASTPLMWRARDGDLTGHSLNDLFETPIDACDIQGGTGSGFPSGATITTCRRGDGSSFPAELRLGVAEQEGERVCVAFVRDLSDRMAMEDQLNGLSFQLMHLSRQNAMGELAGDIAHEINQPLTAATNYASTAAYVLEQRGDTDKALDHLKKITAQLLRAGGIISRLRAFLANREIELRRESLDAVVQDAVNLVRIGSRRVRGRLTVAIPPDLPPVYVDRIQIQQVLVNLLRNSFEACDEAGRSARITISARRSGDHLVEIEVADNGAGLPEGFAERLGQRFSSTKGESGLGIGLNISKRIVEAHGGTLTAANRQYEGAAFRFTVPALGELPQL